MTAAYEVERAREARNDELLALYRAGLTLRRMAQHYGISPERVRQIIARDQQKRRSAVADLQWAIHPDELRGKRAALLGCLLVRVAMGHRHER